MESKTTTVLLLAQEINAFLALIKIQNYKRIKIIREGHEQSEFLHINIWKQIQ